MLVFLNFFKLVVKEFLGIGYDSKVMFILSQSFILVFKFARSLIEKLVLTIELMQVKFKLLVASLKLINSSLRVFFDNRNKVLNFFDLQLVSLNLNVLLLDFILLYTESMVQFLSLALILVQIIHIINELFKHQNLYEFFQTKMVLRLVLKLNIGFLRDNKALLLQVLLV
mmetsp:Transcript_18283/g.25340  ORF Transcript_18283/g.25340 Transcript_18283/m.25340 type:complete len:170 (-) Transcript_18283:673-1182(-)